MDISTQNCALSVIKVLPPKLKIELGLQRIWRIVITRSYLVWKKFLRSYPCRSECVETDIALNCPQTPASWGKLDPTNDDSALEAVKYEYINYARAPALSDTPNTLLPCIKKTTCSTH